MNNRYSSLLQPLRIGDVLLKNRMIYSRGFPMSLQGPEPYPTDAAISYYANIAKNGAAVVTVTDIARSGLLGMTGKNPHSPDWDVENPSVQNYMFQLAEAIHLYGAKASVGLSVESPAGYNISSVKAYSPPEKKNTDVARIEHTVASMGEPLVPGTQYPRLGSVAEAKEIPAEMIEDIIKNAVKRAMYYQWLGFDMCNIHMAYRGSLLAWSLSPAVNKRTDCYGGSPEGRAEFAHRLFQAIKKACGPKFLIEAEISGVEDAPDGYTLDDLISYLHVWQDSLDIVQLRAPDFPLSHPTGFNSVKEHPYTIDYAEAIKKSGIDVITAPVGGYQSPEISNRFIAEGKTDMIAMARAFICDPEFGHKLYENRGEDIVPCIRCNNCHGYSRRGKWYPVCSVNPLHGVTNTANLTVRPVLRSKKIAVVGGGPAGMKAAITAAERGHDVTLFEKKPQLGGQLLHADFASFKWPIRDFKNYLITQVYKQGVDVRLNTHATREMLTSYEIVIAALGAEARAPDVPGLDAVNAWTPLNVFGCENKLGKNVAIVGGGAIGVETGMYLAETGHQVVILTRQDKLAPEVQTLHYEDCFRDAYESLENLQYICQATVLCVDNGKLHYKKASGESGWVSFDDIVVASGMCPKHEEAASLYGVSEQFYVIGDCQEVSNIQKCMRSAYGIASQL